MQIDEHHTDSEPGTEDRFTGAVWLDALARPAPPSRLRVLSVHFTPGARTYWHRHRLGQVLHITDGRGRVQSRGDEVMEVRAGDTVWIEPGEVHWHGAAPGVLMTHLSIQETSDSSADTEWLEAVSDLQYRATMSTGA